jgi:hypothetical protein
MPDVEINTKSRKMAERRIRRLVTVRMENNTITTPNMANIS